MLSGIPMHGRTKDFTFCAALSFPRGGDAEGFFVFLSTGSRCGLYVAAGRGSLVKISIPSPTWLYFS